MTKSFGTGEAAVAALRGIDHDVCDGELLLLVGPSGCGKTTLLSIIGAMLERDGGDAFSTRPRSANMSQMTSLPEAGCRSLPN